MADVSIRSNQSVLSRSARPESGRLHRKYPYRWLFDQVHVKSLIFHVELGLLAIAIVGLYHASQMSSDQNIEPLAIPGFDGLPWTGGVENGKHRWPHYMLARNILNLFSYFFIISVICGFVGMRLSETTITRRNFPPHVNPASLLIPSAISVITFLYPLLLWTLRTFHSMLRFLIKEKLRPSILLDSIRMSLIPIIIIWAVYIYFLYGVWLGVLYYQRRGDQPMPSASSQSSPFRRPLRKQLIPLRAKGSNLLSDLSAVSLELSTPLPHCAPPTAPSSKGRHNRSVSPRGFRQLETVDEEAQSRTSSD